MNWRIEFYRTKSGKCPVEEFLDSLIARQAENILSAMELLKNFGIKLREPYVKSLGDKLFELRVKGVLGQYRMIYFAAKGRKFVMLHGFMKKTKKTPIRELKLAKKRMKEYLNG